MGHAMFLGQNPCERSTLARGQGEQVKSKAFHKQALGQQTHVFVSKRVCDDFDNGSPDDDYTNYSSSGEEEADVKGQDGACSGFGQNQYDQCIVARGQREQVKRKASHNQSLGQQTHVLVAHKAHDDFDSGGPEYNDKYCSYMTKKKPT